MSVFDFVSFNVLYLIFMFAFFGFRYFRLLLFVIVSCGAFCWLCLVSFGLVLLVCILVVML